MAMQISGEGKIGIFLGLVGIGGGGILFVSPHPYADYFGWSLIGIATPPPVPSQCVLELILARSPA
jgi:hypothetical protein